MILHKYDEEIKNAKYPKYKAMDIAYKLNQQDPLNYYLILYVAPHAYSIEKFGIKGAIRNEH